MAEKSAKKKKGSSDANVLASLPATRPSRLGRHARDGAPTVDKAAAGTRAKPTAAKAASAAAKAKPAAKAKAKAKAKPKQAAKQAAPEQVPVADVTQAKPQRPRPVRSASDSLKAAPPKATGPQKGSRPPSGTELVTTVVQAAGELASVGFSIGGQIVKRAVDRLPKP